MQNYDKNNNIYIEWYKENQSDQIWWGTVYYGISEDDIKSGRVSSSDLNDATGFGDHVFSFDKKKAYWLFRDYPWALNQYEKEIFDKENPYWKEFFKDRQ